MVARYVFWGNEIVTEPPVVDYGTVMQSDEGVQNWISLIVTHLFLLNPKTSLTFP